MCVHMSVQVVTAGLPFGTPGIANILRVLPAAGPDVWDPTLTNDMGEFDVSPYD